MVNSKKGQISVEYLIVTGFVTFLVIALLGIAFFYIGSVQDQIKERQIGSFANQLINSANSVFFSGEPSKTTIRAYLPSGVNNISVYSDGVYIAYMLSSGENSKFYSSEVPLTGSISLRSGTKIIKVTSGASEVNITSN